jgi:two-component system, response regulator PdtaR
MRIMIVEDDRLLAAGLAMMVENAGHEVVGHAVTVRAAMDVARAQTPDLTLMDIDLGLGGSGIAAARGMKKHHGLVSLFVTEHPERARQAADAALGVLAKPYDHDTVLRTLDVASTLLASRQPAGDLPAGLELFPAEPAADTTADASIEMGH